MPQLTLHHVSIVMTDLARSIAFYRDIFDLEQIERPPFPGPGAWFACGGRLQIHLIANPAGTFRHNPRVDKSDCHFAFRTDDFEAAVSRLIAKGFHEDGGEDDPKHLHVVRKGVAGFPQVYLLDPDRNIIEINGAP